MHRVTAALVVALSGCVAQPQGSVVFRPAAEPIYSAAAFDAKRLDGRWVQAAVFQKPGQASCPPGSLEFLRGKNGLSVKGALCLDGQTRRIAGPVEQIGPGRLRLAGMTDWWVLWVDSGYRTLAIGTPSGGFGFLLDRGAISQDRFSAAREIFDFNGYVVSALAPI